MMKSNVSLLPYNTFGIDMPARHFIEVSSIAELKTALKTKTQPLFVLGGGSNVLFTRPLEGLVIKNNIGGIRIVRSFKKRVWVEAGGGVVWHELVQWAVSNGYGGIENMSLIPGTVGAAPIQNIGAYGVELKDVFVSLQAMDLSSGKLKTFYWKDCQFGYRDSVFKRQQKGKFMITSVVFSLTCPGFHHIQIGYGDIQRTLQQHNISTPGIADVSRAVIEIRQSKLPDPAKIGNCGSFFKNPEVTRTLYQQIQAQYPAAPGFELPGDRVKVPAGWLIEQCGWKGKRVGNTGSYEKQALVLVNYGGATGEEVRQLAYRIIDSVQEKFGIKLEPEVNII